MSDKVLYREWRPLDFDQVVGQEHVVAALRQSSISGEIAHAYLFSGTRGTGKTSLAKIFARAVNCNNISETGNPCNSCEICAEAIKGNLMDIIEMDAASNNSVDDIRQITEEVLFLPSLGKYKVYIIDEVHMLSTAAFNALLKTLEEPPAHAIFILATTEPQRIPATILSRCQRYDFKRIKIQDMSERLSLIAKSNNIDISKDAIMTINNFSEGALRDAISLLDQARSIYKGRITRDDILNMTGIISDDFLENIVISLVEGNVDNLMQSIDKLIIDGGDISRFTTALAQYFRNLLVYKTSKSPDKILQVPIQTMKNLAKLANYYSSTDLIKHITFLAELQQNLKRTNNPRIILEVNLIQLLEEIAIKEEIEFINQSKDMSKDVRSKDDISNDKVSDLEEPNYAIKLNELNTVKTNSDFFDLNLALETNVDTKAEASNKLKDQDESSIDNYSTLEYSNLDKNDSLDDISIQTQSILNTQDKSNTNTGMPADKDNTNKHNDIDIELLWKQFLFKLNDNDPLFAILLESTKHFIDYPNFIIEFSQADKNIYDRIIQKDINTRVQKAFQEVSSGTGLELKYYIEGTDSTFIDENKNDSELEWVSRMRRIAKEMDIPLEDEENE